MMAKEDEKNKKENPRRKTYLEARSIPCSHEANDDDDRRLWQISAGAVSFSRTQRIP